MKKKGRPDCRMPCTTVYAQTFGLQGTTNPSPAVSHLLLARDSLAVFSNPPLRHIKSDSLHSLKKSGFVFASFAPPAFSWVPFVLEKRGTHRMATEQLMGATGRYLGRSLGSLVSPESGLGRLKALSPSFNFEIHIYVRALHCLIARLDALLLGKRCQCLSSVYSPGHGMESPH